MTVLFFIRAASVTDDRVRQRKKAAYRLPFQCSTPVQSRVARYRHLNLIHARQQKSPLAAASSTVVSLRCRTWSTHQSDLTHLICPRDARTRHPAKKKGPLALTLLSVIILRCRLGLSQLRVVTRLMASFRAGWMKYDDLNAHYKNPQQRG